MTTSYSDFGSGSRQAGFQPAWPLRACWRRVRSEYLMGDWALAGGCAGERVGQMARRFKAEICRRPAEPAEFNSIAWPRSVCSSLWRVEQSLEGPGAAGCDGPKTG